jgi:hypothetical protein
VSFPYLTLLQNFTTTPNDYMIDTNFNNVFLWNNGQKIFVGTSNGLKSRISIYERNNPYGTSWTKLSNVA